MSESKVLVTGATGFIGCALCESLSESGHIVVGSGRREAVGPWHSFMSMDLTCTQSELKLDGIKTVFHLASKAHAVSERPGAQDGYYETIVAGTRRLVEAAVVAGVEQFIYMSSVKAMEEGGAGSLEHAPIDETCNARPMTPYGRAKLEAEQIVLQSSIPHVSILRPVMVYGPGHKGNLVRMAEAIKAKRFPPIKECGNRRSVVHLDDLIDACLGVVSVPEANREVFIITSSKALSTRQLYDCLRAELHLVPVNWSIPQLALRGVAIIGDILGKLLRRRMPLDSDTLGKLIGSAWYSNAKSRKVLGISYENENRPYLEGNH